MLQRSGGSEAGAPVLSMAFLTHDGVDTDSKGGSENELPKRLAASDKKVRDKAFAMLQQWISSKTSLSDAEWKKLWKGLFYGMWHADKPHVQADVAQKICNVMQAVREFDDAVSFFNIFLWTMRREWSGIDKLRMDKFYMFVRKMMAQVFAYLQSSNWEPRLTKMLMTSLADNALIADDKELAMGMNLHIADIYVELLEKCTSLSSDTFSMLLEPLTRTLAVSRDKLLLGRVKENVFERLLDLSQQAGVEEGLADIAGLISPAQIYTELFALASLPNVQGTNRKVLHEICDGYRKFVSAQALEGVAVAVAEKFKEVEMHERVDNTQCFPGAEESGIACCSVGDTSNCQPAAEDGLASGEGKQPHTNGGTAGSGDALPTPNISNKGRKKKKKSPEEEVGKGSILQPGDTMQEATGAGLPAADGMPEFPIADWDVDTEVETGGGQTATVGSAEGQVGNGKQRGLLLGRGANGQALHEQPPHGAMCSPPAGTWQLNGHLTLEELTPQNTADREGDACEEEGDDWNVARATGKGRGKKTLKRKRQVEEQLEGAAGDGESGMVTPVAGPTPKRKKVRFAMRNNLVWKKTDPVPPASIRTPPAAAPRGSALKSGVQPGPINMKALNADTTVGRARKRPNILISAPVRIPRSKRLLKMLRAKVLR
eukprot:TRINITY_DN19753_c0_g2_i1.p1 TRINITY_DN19753_c0_g2~~TRINITY_DN19753_c0_g2_i1.p1  ORF type:complete len:658 (-),score=156.45 TRINITY_DN19753_c0_g2_i1:433-2406(-)